MSRVNKKNKIFVNQRFTILLQILHHNLIEIELMMESSVPLNLQIEEDNSQTIPKMMILDMTHIKIRTKILKEEYEENEEQYRYFKERFYSKGFFSSLNSVDEVLSFLFFLF